MQLVPIKFHTLIQPVTPATRRAAKPEQQRPQARLGDPKAFASLKDSGLLEFQDFVEAEFEDVAEDGSNPKARRASYWNVLFPEFLLKSRYVDYYV